MLRGRYSGILMLDDTPRENADNPELAGWSGHKRSGDAMIWNIISTIATLLSAIAYVITIYYLRAEQRNVEKDRYFNITVGLYAIWQSREFMEDQLWLLHQLKETDWQSFIAAHRADRGEIAFHRVGSFYDRVGTLVKMDLINGQEILSTMGGHAIAVWSRIEPLVREARRLEHSTLFNDFERLLPSCYECYVPALGDNLQVQPFSLQLPGDKIDVTELEKLMKRGDAPTILDARQPAQFEREPQVLPHALVIPPDSILERYHEIPKEREVVVYCA